MAGKILKWESELWSYLSTGDGVTCPLHKYCQIRQQGGDCLNDDQQTIDRILSFIDGDEISQHSHEPLKFNFQMCTGSGRLFKLIGMLADSYLKKAGVCCPPVPTELVSLADEQRTIEARLLSLKAYHGAIWRLREGWVVQLKDSDTSASKRFTIFHEVFHILAHCSSTPVFRKIGTREGSFNELLADCFSTRLQVPKEWAKEKWAEVEDLDRLAEIFDVPKPAMCIRLRQLGLV